MMRIRFADRCDKDTLHPASGERGHDVAIRRPQTAPLRRSALWSRLSLQRKP